MSARDGAPGVPGPSRLPTLEELQLQLCGDLAGEGVNMLNFTLVFEGMTQMILNG